MARRSDYWKNPEHHREKAKQFHKRHRERILAKYKADPEPRRGKSRAHYWNNRDQILASMKARYQENREQYKSKSKEKRQALRLSVLVKLGAECACCQEADLCFLTLDHKNGGGRVHFTVRGSWGAYRDVLNDPDAAKNYQVLCANCNMAKARYGECPHQTRKSGAA